MGYAPALLWELTGDDGKSRWKPIVCPVTEAMADALAGLQLVGLVVELERPGRRANGPIFCKPVDRPVKDPLPPAFDVVPILLRMWRLRAAGAGRGGPDHPDILRFYAPNGGEGKEAQA